MYPLFAGQPLAVLSATGALVVFERVIYDLCESVANYRSLVERFEDLKFPCFRTNGWNFLEARCWLGLWTAAFLIVIVATDASVIVALITKFTEEAFATLTSILFIVNAMQSLAKTQRRFPITRDVESALDQICNGTNNGNGTSLYGNSTAAGRVGLNQLEFHFV